MLQYGKARAIQQQRAAKFVAERERAAARRRAAEDEPGGLYEILNALAQGLASIGIPGERGWHPARPAY